MIDQISSSINQSFRLVFQSIRKGIRLIFDQVVKVVDALARIIKWFHRMIAMAIQLIINLSSLVFIVFVPFVFFIDPLGWSSYLHQYLSTNVVFWGRMILGCFFVLVAYLVLVTLWKTFRQATPANIPDEQKKKDFVQQISSAFSWVVIGLVFIYFTIFRYQLLDIPFDLTELGNIFGI